MTSRDPRSLTEGKMEVTMLGDTRKTHWHTVRKYLTLDIFPLNKPNFYVHVMFSGSECATPTNSILQLMSCFAQLAEDWEHFAVCTPADGTGAQQRGPCTGSAVGSRWDAGIIPAPDVGALLCAEQLVEGSNCPQFCVLEERRDQLKNLTRVTDCVFSFLT